MANIRLPYHELLPTFDKALRYYLSEHQLSPKLSLTDLSHFGTTQIGKQALWILTNAVQPYEPQKP